MIRLFSGTETDFTHDGVEVLDDIVISSFTDWKENSKWIIEAKFKKDLDKSEQLKNGMILKVPTEKGEQLFQILKTNKKNRKFITVYGHAIGHSFNDNFIQDVNIVEKSGRAAIQQISSGAVEKHRYNLSSNIDTVASARMVRKNGIDALLGDKENSFVSRWGGYLVLDNFNIAINNSIGTDKGVEIAIGKNVIQYDGTIDEAPVVTGINPITYDGLTLPEGIYYSPLAGNYANKKIKEFKFDSIKYKYSNNNTNEEGYETLEEVYEAIRKACDDLFNVSNIDKPTCSLRVDIAALEHTDQYKGDELNERIFQGDILTANLDDYGFDVKLKMVANRYDNVRDKYIDIDLGDAKSNALSNIGKVENIIDKVVDQLGGNTWQDIIDKSMQEASQLIAEGIKDSYVVARKNEILIMDSPEVESAINVIRMNKNGIAFSQSGYNGPYTVAITIDGKINANCIMTGELNAALIKAGILSDVTGRTWINMENGTFSFADKITFDGNNVNINANQIQVNSENVTTIENVKSEIKQEADKINSSITSLDGKYNTVTQEIKDGVNQFKVSVGNSGGANLLKNGRAILGTDNWANYEGNGIFTTWDSSNEWILDNKKVLCMYSNNSTKECAFYQWIPTTIGVTYTLTYLIAGHGGATKSIYCREQNTWNVIASKHYGHIDGGKDIRKWAKDSITFTATTPQTNIWFSIQGVDSWFWATDLIVNEGGVSQPWQSHQSEVSGSHTKLTDTEFEVKFNNGTRLLASQDLPLTLFDGSSQRQYHALSESGTIVLGGYNGTFPVEAWVQLPAIFKGKQFKVSTSMNQTQGGHSDAEWVQKIRQDVIEYDYTNGRFKVWGSWWSRTTADDIFQKELMISWIAIA